MKKEELKAIIENMCDNLDQNIEESDSVSIESVVEYLRDAALVVANIDEKDVHSIEQAKAAFDNAYKEIAEQSLESYNLTSSRFEELSQLQEETLQEMQGSHIDLPKIATKFNDIQCHMTQEVEKANEIITQLTDQVKTLEARSNLDSLTKVFNRRALNTYLNTICFDKNYVNANIHLLILDIDDFKQVNDKHGHLAGDKVLIFIANILRKTLRDGDKIFRYGGEEFIISLNRIDDAQCLAISERLLELVRSNKLLYKGESLSVTMSIGATKLVHGDTPEEIINRADIALYKSKNNGKNQMNTEIAHGI